jgi:hypothetical protein
MLESVKGYQETSILNSSSNFTKKYRSLEKRPQQVAGVFLSFLFFSLAYFDHFEFKIVKLSILIRANHIYA